MCLAFVNGWPFFAPIKASREIQPGPVSREGAKPRSKNELWAAGRCFRYPARIVKLKTASKSAKTSYDY
jgi:hypothetical protein